MHTQPISAGEQPHVQSPESVHVRKQGLYNLTAIVLEVAQHVQEVLWFFPLSFQRQGMQPGFYVGKKDGLTYYVCNNPGNLCYYLVVLPQLHLSKDETICCYGCTQGNHGKEYYSQTPSREG